MFISETTKKLLNRDLNQLKFANIKNYQWSLGGGSILKYFYNHRESNDIDIFFQDLQLISFVSPRINDANESLLSDYSELSNFVKLCFQDGDIDFIFSNQITDLKPKKTIISGYEIFIDQPVEIIAKKIFYRCQTLSITFRRNS